MAPTIADVVAALGDLGLGWVIGVGALVFFAGLVYHRMRK